MRQPSHECRLRMRDNQSGEMCEHAVTFTDEEWRQLHDYLGHVADHQATQFVAGNRSVSLHFDWREGDAPKWSVQTPPDDEISAFIHRLRPLILQREPACFPKVRALLNRKLKDAPVQPLMRWLLDVYEGKEFQQLIRMQSNDRIMNSDEMLVIWLNAFEYHRDRDKQELLAQHSKVMPLEWSRGVFVNLLIEKTKAISNLAALVELLLGKRDSLSVRL